MLDQLATTLGMHGESITNNYTVQQKSLTAPFFIVVHGVSLVPRPHAAWVRGYAWGALLPSIVPRFMKVAQSLAGAAEQVRQTQQSPDQCFD